MFAVVAGSTKKRAAVLDGVAAHVRAGSPLSDVSTNSAPPQAAPRTPINNNNALLHGRHATASEYSDVGRSKNKPPCDEGTSSVLTTSWRSCLQTLQRSAERRQSVAPLAYNRGTNVTPCCLQPLLLLAGEELLSSRLLPCTKRRKVQRMTSSDQINQSFLVPLVW